ncbi:MAG: nuclear transport factor 2 family protein, partial [Chloroflexia bacterium]|nr:nuclear transport factor 2 family protein [Chloroflexia bacterium]
VRLYGEAAVIRYLARIEIVVGGEATPLRHYWHTDLYEKRFGDWRNIWSQATAIQ